MSDAVKVLHTSDWHLGKRLYRLERLPEQEKFLDWLLKEIKDRQVDLLIVSGDIFDVPNPPHTAIKLFYKFIAQLEEIKCHSLIISGNHDSGHLVSAVTPLIDPDYTSIIGSLESIEQLSFVKEINGVKIGLSSLPFFRLHQITKLLDEEIDGIIPILDKFIESCLKKIEDCSIKIFAGHHLFGSFMASGSEQTLILNEVDAIPLSLFKDRYDYLALGHIHKPQIIKNENPRAVYSGSPIPMRFAEREKKVVELINHTSNETTFESINVPKFRQLIELKLSEEEIEQNIDKKLNQLDSKDLNTVVEITLELKKPIAGIYDRIGSYIKTKYPTIDILSFKSRFQSEKDNEQVSNDFRLPSTVELFERFYLYKYPDSSKVPSEVLSHFKSILDQLHQQNVDNETK